DRGAGCARALDQAAQRGLELRRAHVVRVAAQRVVLPEVVRRSGLGPAMAPEVRFMGVADAGRAEAACERRSRELRMAAGDGEAPHVDDVCDTGVLEKGYESFEGARGMADGPDLHAVQARVRR